MVALPQQSSAGAEVDRQGSGSQGPDAAAARGRPLPARSGARGVQPRRHPRTRGLPRDQPRDLAADGDGGPRHHADAGIRGRIRRSVRSAGWRCGPSPSRRRCAPSGAVWRKTSTRARGHRAPFATWCTTSWPAKELTIAAMTADSQNAPAPAGIRLGVPGEQRRGIRRAGARRASTGACASISARRALEELCALAAAARKRARATVPAAPPGC